MENVNNYSEFDFRIKKIKNTIDDIRLNLQDLKTDNLGSSNRSAAFNENQNEVSFKNNIPDQYLTNNKYDNDSFGNEVYPKNMTEESPYDNLPSFPSKNPKKEGYNNKNKYLPLFTNENNLSPIKYKDTNSHNRTENNHYIYSTENYSNLYTEPTFPSKNRSSSPLKLNYDYNRSKNRNSMIPPRQVIIETIPDNDNRNNRSDSGDRIKDYEMQIAELKVKINELQKNNIILQTKLSQQKQIINNPNSNYIKDDYVRSDNSSEIIVSELQSFFGDVKKEDIIEICKRQTEKLIKYKKQEEFIEKVRKLYHKFYENKTEKVKLKTLWGWIKSVIRYISHQSKEIICKKNYSECEELCNQLIKDFNLKDTEELKCFVNQISIKNEKNKQRVHKMKKILFTNPNEAKFVVNTYNN